MSEEGKVFAWIMGSILATIVCITANSMYSTHKEAEFKKQAASIGMSTLDASCAWSISSANVGVCTLLAASKK